MHTIENLREITDKEIEKMNFAGHPPRELYQPVDYIMSVGGKRLRPVLALLTCQLFSDDITPCIKPAVAIELFHNFTLLHDDIMDKADIRRGKPTVHKKWNENTAILSGDAMVVISFDLISSADPEILPQLLTVYNKTAIEVCEGQQMDMNFETMLHVDEESYLKMIRLKTAVLIAAAMKIGAITGGASENDASLMYDSGLNLGMAFQLQDDLLDLYAEKEKFGKKPGGDILMNKKTILLIKAFQRADAGTAEKLSNLLEKENDPEIKVNEIRKIFDRLDIETIAGKMAESYFKGSIASLNATNSLKQRKKEFTGFIETVMNRKS
ncbi:MAG: polyprenyl synthetase family protein [Bacteroidales bacterium]